MAEPDIVDTWERFARFHRQATRAMDQSLRTTFGHTLDDYDILHQINRHDGPMRMGDLAEQLLVANSSCHRIVGRLVEAGLIERRHDNVDGRVVLVGLTTEGKRIYRRMAATHTRDIRRLVGAPLDRTAHVALDAALERLTGPLNAEASSPTGALLR